MNKTVVNGLVALLATVLFSGPLSAAGEQEYILDKTFDSSVPVFMDGHEGDMNWVKGFVFTGDILLGGTPIGTVSGEATFWNPPMNFLEVYDQASVTMTNNIDGMGSFEVYAQAVAMGSSTTATVGDVIVSWAGSIANGTGSLSNLYGLSAGNIGTNIFLGTASGTEVLRLRFGF